VAGCGFRGLLEPPHISQLGSSDVSGAPSAHNGFLEELLNTGMVGLTILLAFCLATLTIALRRAKRGDPLGWWSSCSWFSTCCSI
jgi:hypothetical protein